MQSIEQETPAPDLDQQNVILVVDDEILIRFAVAAYLRECGYRVLEAANADEAVMLLSTNSNVNIVFSDVQMPGSMDGFGLARWVRLHAPSVKMILTSGIARTADLAEDLCELGPIEVKPYDARSLDIRIRAMLADQSR